MRVEGLVYTFRLADPEFRSWGLFQARDTATAVAIGEPRPAEPGNYTRRLEPVRLRLAFPLRSRTWLAVPAFPSDVRPLPGVNKQPGGVRPVLVHLVERSRPLARIRAR